VAQAPIREVGFIGLGVMGLPMAINLVRAGVHVTAYSRSPSPVELFVRAGGTGASSIEQAARDKDCVVMMLPDTPDVERVLLTPGGVVESARRGTVVLDMSTISPLATRRFATTLRTHGLDLVDAPVSGGQTGAENATLSIMVGGSDTAFARVHPILEMLGKTIVHIGDSGAGQVAKACNQLIVGVTIEAVAEALTLAQAAGVSPRRTREALLGGFAASRVLEVHGQRMLDVNFQPGFRARLHLKDAEIIRETSRQLTLDLPAAEVARAALQRLVDAGGGDQDHSALVTTIENARFPFTDPA
jgi:2-hydroxy-3-oxopropionate reductase